MAFFCAPGYEIREGSLALLGLRMVLEIRIPSRISQYDKAPSVFVFLFTCLFSIDDQGITVLFRIYMPFLGMKIIAKRHLCYFTETLELSSVILSIFTSFNHCLIYLK